MGSAEIVGNGHSEKMRLKIRQSIILASCSAILLGAQTALVSNLVWMRHLAMVRKVRKAGQRLSMNQILSSSFQISLFQHFCTICWITEGNQYWSLPSQEVGFPLILSEN